MDILVERCAGVDIGKADVKACVRVVGPGKIHTEVRTYATTTNQLLMLRQWLVDEQVTRVGMEATGDYWKPVYYLLEDGLECWLLNARHMRTIPGRKTDVKDSEWIAQLVQYGLVRPSFVPPPPIRRLRDLTRYRTTLIRDRVREKQRLEKILEDAGITVTAMITDMFGVSGRRMLQALISGERDPAVLAEHAQKRMRRKIPQLVEGLTGRFTAHHAFLCRTMLDRIDEITTAIENLTARIDTEITPFQDLITLLDTIPGISAYLAQGILAEIGADMNRFTSPAHLASWAGMCPGNNESAGKHHSGRTRPGDMWLRGYLGEAALAAARTTTSYYHTRYQRIARRRGKKRALVAIAHALLTAIWHVLHDHLPHRDLGPDYYTQHTNPDRRRNRLITELHQLGYHVTLEKTAA